MEQAHLISIIVPIYKIDRYLGICIESLIKQTYKNIEIILVDDGSPDRCPEICDLYSKKDSRIKVIHKENGGLVSARKAGMKIAKGEYIGYVDGDDWVEESYYEDLYKNIITTNSDVVIGNYSRDLFNIFVEMKNNIPIKLYEKKDLQDFYSKMILDDKFWKIGVTTYLWNKLFKKEVVEKFQLQVDERITIGEDAAVVYLALLNSKRVVVTDNSKYHYRQREDSMLKKNENYYKEFSDLKILYNYLSDNIKEYPKGYKLKEQIDDFVLGLYIMRSGGILKHKIYNYLPNYEKIKDKNVAIYNAGTFGQQLVKRIKENNFCNIVGWYDEDYWEYRRCCLDVDSTELVKESNFDYILIATINEEIADGIEDKLLASNISKDKILKFYYPKNIREKLLSLYLES